MVFFAQRLLDPALQFLATQIQFQILFAEMILVNTLSEGSATHGTKGSILHHEDAVGRSLFRILREFDDEDVEVIYSESFGGSGLGQAIMNRLLKAAGHRVEHITEEE